MLGLGRVGVLGGRGAGQARVDGSLGLCPMWHIWLEEVRVWRDFEGE